MKILVPKIFIMNMFLMTLILFNPFLVQAQQQELEDTYPLVEVTEIIENLYPLSASGIEIETQKLQIEFKNGDVSKKVNNDYTTVEVGDSVYVTKGYDTETQEEIYFVREINRTKSL